MMETPKLAADTVLQNRYRIMSLLNQGGMGRVYLAEDLRFRSRVAVKEAYLTKNVVEAVRQLKQRPGKNILVDGSSVLTQALAQNDLVDEYSLHVYPLVLGGGKRLYPEGKRLDLTLVEAAPLPTGVVFMRYRRTA